MAATVTSLRRRAAPPAGGLLIAVVPGRVTIQHLGLSEREGSASARMADQFRPELDALAFAAQRLGERGAA